MTPDTDSTSVAEQAAHWWVVFHERDVSDADHREFAEWMFRSPERVEAYLRVVRLQNAVGAARSVLPDTPVAELIRAAVAAPPEAIPFNKSRRTPSPDSSQPASFRVRIAWGLAATLLVASGLAFFIGSRPQQFETRFGEQRSVLLSDGSRVTLNSASRLEVRMQKDHRVVRLVSGEALFEVAHDAARPFDVHAENAVLRAVGTQFDVDVRPSRTTLTVVEGVVAIVSAGSSGAPDAQRLIARDRVEFTTSGAGAAIHEVNLAATTAWMRNQLVFENRPLGEVAEEFNRYNHERIDIASPELRERRITGVFRSNDAASFVAFLASLPGVQVARDADGNHVVSGDRSSAP